MLFGANMCIGMRCIFAQCRIVVGMCGSFVGSESSGSGGESSGISGGSSGISGGSSSSGRCEDREIIIMDDNIIAALICFSATGMV